MLGLRNYWYPLLVSEQLREELPVASCLLGENLVLWRDAAGSPGALVDRCPHRGAKLSSGRILGSDLQCASHGLRFNTRGECTLVPWERGHASRSASIRVPAYPVRELGGYVWAYLGDPRVFPPRDLREEIPEELVRVESYWVVRLPSTVWEESPPPLPPGKFTLPCLTTLVVKLAADEDPWVIRHWRYAVDEQRVAAQTTCARRRISAEQERQWTDPLDQPAPLAALRGILPVQLHDVVTCLLSSDGRAGGLDDVGTSDRESLLERAHAEQERG